jgi:hypothetical protein
LASQARVSPKGEGRSAAKESIEEIMLPENPRLMIALIAVIDAQKMNGTVIRNPMM